jgi:hypothetical protein
MKYIIGFIAAVIVIVGAILLIGSVLGAISC